MYRILVTGVGSNIGQGIIKSLRMSSFRCKIIGTDIHPLSAGLYRCDKCYIIPPAKDRGFISKIIDICVDENVDAILIGSDAEVLAFAQNKNTIEKSCRAKVIVSQPSFIETVSDKLSVVDFLKKEGLNFPRSAPGNVNKDVEQLLNLCGFPLIVKPRRGAGSRGVSVARNQDELSYLIQFIPDPVVQEVLGSQEAEYTAGLFFSKNAEPKGTIIMRRELIFGTTYRAIADYYPKVEQEARYAAQSLSRLGAIGPINLQLRLMDKGAVIFEINPRFSGTTSFRAKLGFNEAEAIIRNFLLGEEISELICSKGVMMRYWNEIYTSIDEVDRIIKKGSLDNPQSEVLYLL